MKIPDWQSLLNEVRHCSLCKQALPLAPRPILQLHPDAKILIVGQAPGRLTHHKGVPFDDPSGNRLRDWLGVDRETFYNPRHFAIIPMGFCYPGKGKNGDLPPRTECATHWRQQLLDQLPNIELTMVIGQYAHAWHLGPTRKATLTETVKHWREYWPELLPLPHPSPRNLGWLKKNPWFDQEVVPTLKNRAERILANQL